MEPGGRPPAHSGSGRIRRPIRGHGGPTGIRRCRRKAGRAKRRCGTRLAGSWRPPNPAPARPRPAGPARTPTRRATPPAPRCLPGCCPAAPPRRPPTAGPAARANAAAAARRWRSRLRPAPGAPGATRWRTCPARPPTPARPARPGRGHRSARTGTARRWARRCPASVGTRTRGLPWQRPAGRTGPHAGPAVGGRRWTRPATAGAIGSGIVRPPTPTGSPARSSAAGTADRSRAYPSPCRASCPSPARRRCR